MGAGKAQQLGHVAAEELAARIDARAIGEPDRFDTPANPIARFEQHDIPARLHQLGGRGEAGKTGADDDDIMAGHGETPSF